MHACMHAYIHKHINPSIHACMHAHIPFHYMSIHSIALHCTALHDISFHFISFHFISFHFIGLHCIALRCVALHCIHTYILTSMHGSMHTCIHTCMHAYIPTDEHMLCERRTHTHTHSADVWHTRTEMYVHKSTHTKYMNCPFLIFGIWVLVPTFTPNPKLFCPYVKRMKVLLASGL